MRRGTSSKRKIARSVIDRLEERGGAVTGKVAGGRKRKRGSSNNKKNQKTGGRACFSKIPEKESGKVILTTKGSIDEIKRGKRRLRAGCKGEKKMEGERGVRAAIKMKRVLGEER